MIEYCGQMKNIEEGLNHEYTKIEDDYRKISFRP